jgi:ribose/xylose/arabinose/galactoside ABC-type transport system permease subunit
MKNQNVTKLLHRFRQPLVLAALGLFFTLTLPGLFFTRANLISILYQVALYGIMICGAMFPVLVGGIDRTVGGVAAMGGAVCVTIIVNNGYSTPSVVIGVLAALGIGLLSGLIHGIIIANLEIPAFLLTLATSQVIYGIVQTITGNRLIVIMRPEIFTGIGTMRIFGAPLPVYVLIACFCAMLFLLNKTTYGRRIYSVGGNREASKLSGINVKRTIVIAYMMSGLMASIAGIVLSSMNQQASSYAAQGYENDVLAAIVVGGVSLRGGAGTLPGAIFGTLLIGIMNNGLRLLGVNSIYHNLIKGIIIIVAVAFDMFSSYRLSGLKRRGFLSRLFKKETVS